MMLMRKVADSGQAVLSTIHQPSTMLFQQFDRLLFLAKGGRTVYFGDVGQGSRVLLDYFEAGGARKCGAAENPVSASKTHSVIAAWKFCVAIWACADIYPL